MSINIIFFLRNWQPVWKNVKQMTRKIFFLEFIGKRRELASIKISILIKFLLFSIVILTFVNLFKFYRKSYLINCDFDSTLHNIFLKEINDQSKKLKSEIQVVFVFNEVPLRQDLDVIDILLRKFSGGVGIYAFFCRRFQYDDIFRYEHKFLFGKKLKGVSRGIELGPSYFLLINREKIHYADDTFDPKIIGDIIIKECKPSEKPGYLKKEEIISRFLGCYNKKDFYLWNVLHKKQENVNNLPKNSRIYLFPSGRSPCQLNDVIQNLKSKMAFFLEGQVIIIFSFLASANELYNMLIKKGISIPVYIDQSDSLEIGFSTVNINENPIVFDMQKTRNT